MFVVFFFLVRLAAGPDGFVPVNNIRLSYQSFGAGVFGHRGKLSEASALHRELLERVPRSYVLLAFVVLAAEAAGQHEEALAFARRAWDEREPPFILHTRHFPEYRTLRSDPRLAAILREMDEPMASPGRPPGYEPVMVLFDALTAANVPKIQKNIAPISGLRDYRSVDFQSELL